MCNSWKVNGNTVLPTFGQLYLKNHATHKDEACTVALVITCTSQGYHYHKCRFDEQLGVSTSCLIIEETTYLTQQ